MTDLTPELQAHVDALADPNVSDADKHDHLDALQEAGTSIWTLIALALATGTMLVAVKAAVDSGQPTTVADPTTGGPFSLFIDGRRCAVGPIPVAPA